MIHHAIDIARMIRETGGWGGADNRIIAVAVCWAESRFNDQAKFDNTTVGGLGIDRGLMQINSHWQPWVTDECAFNPVCNLAAAATIFKNNNKTFNPWSAFKNGSYKAFMEEAAIAVEADRRLNNLKNQIDQLVSTNNQLSEQNLALKDKITITEQLLADEQRAKQLIQEQLAAKVEELNKINIELQASRAAYSSAKNNFDAWAVELKERIFK